MMLLFNILLLLLGVVQQPPPRLPPVEDPPPPRCSGCRFPTDVDPLAVPICVLEIFTLEGFTLVEPRTTPNSNIFVSYLEVLVDSL